MSVESKECELYRESINEKLSIHDKRLNNYGSRIDNLEQYKAGSEERLKSIEELIKDLSTNMKWFMGTLVASFIGFFFYAIQSNLFK